MNKRVWRYMLPVLAGVLTCPLWISWAETVFHVDVGAVVVSFTVQDGNGKYVGGLQPTDICVREDGVEQEIKSFMDSASAIESNTAGEARQTAEIANSVFILFDTSNCMYERFALAQDMIANFIRHLDARQAVAVYSFSQNLSRLARLTDNHEEAIRGLRSAAAGDATAVLNATLLTIRDAARVPGRKVVVVFSNGPDDASVVSPDDVARIAEEEGIPIYIIATKPHDEMCERAFGLLCSNTGGRLFLATVRPLQVQAFDAIGTDLKHTYTLTYNPRPNENNGWRKIEVEVRNSDGKALKINARKGYRPAINYTAERRTASE